MLVSNTGRGVDELGRPRVRMCSTGLEARAATEANPRSRNRQRHYARGILLGARRRGRKSFPLRPDRNWSVLYGSNSGDRRARWRPAWWPERRHYFATSIRKVVPCPACTRAIARQESARGVYADLFRATTKQRLVDEL